MHTTVRHVALTLLLASLQPGYSDWDNLTKRAELGHPSANVSFPVVWDPASGLDLRVAAKDSNRSVRIVLKPGSGELVPYPSREFPPSIATSCQFNLAALPDAVVTNATLTFKFRPEAWAVYLEHRPVLASSPPLLPPLAILERAAEVPAGAEDKHWIQKCGEDIAYGNNFFEQEGETNLLAQLEIESGTWNLHSVADSAMERRTIDASRSKRIKPEASPNFYSLKGIGTNAIITAGYSFYDMYIFEAALQTVPGEAGLVFMYQDGSRCHAFTVKCVEDSDEALLSLWRPATSEPDKRQYLGAVTVPLTDGQWIKLRVKTFLNRVECYMDNTKVMDMPVELPPGGRFGLFASSAEGVLFDDLLAKSNHDLDFRTVNDIRRYTLHEEGSFLPRRTFFGLFPPRDEVSWLDVSRSRFPQWLVLGAAAHQSHLFEADFDVSPTFYCVGLIAGFRDARQPYYRFTCSGTATNEVFVLERVATNSTETLETMELKSEPPTRQDARTVRLMCDATNEGEIRMYRNGEMVLVHQVESAPDGASGLFVGPFTSARIRNLSYQFERSDLYRNLYEKNRRYVEDPFMRHWSSPEGEWLQQKDKQTWHKEDIFGRFVLHMPFIENSEIHLGVEEGRTNGVMVISARKDALFLSAGPDAHTPNDVLTCAPASGLAGPAQSAGPAAGAKENFYAVHYEGYWLWATSGGKPLFRHMLAAPLKGTRIRIAGFTTDQLKHSYVELFKVKDYLFSESLHEWTINGGVWEVINRFKCDPSWSHMNGESTNATAALWAKFDFKGDFCAEMYTGMRMGWYERPGDHNLTIMNAGASPSIGYTLTCTGWDPDNSQLYTRLYRNGKILAESDKYLVPRQREGGQRRGYEPLINDGRPIHGAWYYIKLRRKGNKLEYYFDNELVFAIDDPEPVESGGFGIWTFMNSMMVARVKIAAEDIRPRPVPFRPASPTDWPGPAPDPRTQLAGYSGVLKDGKPADLTLPGHWEAADPVGRSRLTWHEEQGRGPYFVLGNVLGSGNMFAEADLPATPYHQLAGWRFLVKRTPRAQFNFHYTVGRPGSKGQYLQRQSFFHRLSGSDFSSPQCRLTGSTYVSAAQSAGPGWHKQGDWTPVTVWLPLDIPGALYGDTNILVNVEGFGNLQPSYELQGLTGNRPGESYAVRDFQEIRYAAPKMGIAADSQPPASFAVIDPASGSPLFSCADAGELQAWLEKNTAPGLNGRRVEIRRAEASSVNDLAWIRLPEEASLSCEWDASRPEALALAVPTDYPDRRFSTATMYVGGQLASLLDDGFGRKLGLVPRNDNLMRAASDTLPVAVSILKRKMNFDIARNNEPGAEPPALLGFKGGPVFFENFEQRVPGKSLRTDAGRMELRHFDPDQGTRLAVFNNGRAARLRSDFALNTELTRSPVFSFKYRASGMANVSLSFSDSCYVKLSERYDQAKAVREAKPLKPDGKWHTWTGFVTDGVTQQQMSRNAFSAHRVTFASFGAPDQTGLFTGWEIDDLALGPALSRGEQLAFTPLYFDFDGVASVHMALCGGATPYADMTPDQASGLAWKEIPNKQETVPDISGLEKGLCRVFLKAADTRGHVSAVTDIPFLLDTKPLSVSSKLAKTDDPACNGTVINFSIKNDGGAPLDLQKLELSWNGTNVPPDAMGSTLNHSTKEDLLTLNWPYVFRDELRNSRDGDTNIVCLSHISDGAGNSSPDAAIPITIDYANDHTPPTLLPVGYPSNILWSSAIESAPPTFDARLKLRRGRRVFREGDRFRPNQLATMKVEREPNEAPYLLVVPGGEESELWRDFPNPGWMIDEYPYLAFRIRRPRYEPKEKTRIDVVLKFRDNEEHSLCLTHEPEDKKAVPIDTPISWQSNQWHAVILNVRTLLKDKLPREPKKRRIQSMRFRISKGSKESPLHLQSLFVFAEWQPDDIVEMHAFDASGIEGIIWECTGQDSGVEISPAFAPLRHGGSGWTVVRVKDKAGNITAPLWLPLAPPQANAGPAPGKEPDSEPADPEAREENP